MRKVKKAIIPAAGLGTRFLPATKAIAKEMLPIVDKPTIQFIVEEAISSEIEDILVITGKAKRPIEDHFDSNFELEHNLASKGKMELLALIEETTGINLHFVRQKRPLGLGHAILQAKAFVGDDPFVVMLGDDITESKVPLTKQLIHCYHKTKGPTLSVMKVSKKEIPKYGIIDPEESLSNKLYTVRQFVEKPSYQNAPSNLAIIGRYLLTPKIFEILEYQEPDSGNEIQLTDAIDKLNRIQKVFAYEFRGKRYDVGDKLGMLKANIEYGLKHPNIEKELKSYLKSLINYI